MPVKNGGNKIQCEHMSRNREKRAKPPHTTPIHNMFWASCVVFCLSVVLLCCLAFLK